MTTAQLDIIQEGEVYINNKQNGLDKPSKILVKYPYTIKKELRLIEKLGIINKEIKEKVQKIWQTTFAWEKS